MPNQPQPWKSHIPCLSAIRAGAEAAIPSSGSRRGFRNCLGGKGEFPLVQSNKSGIIITLSKIILRQEQDPAEKVVQSQNVAPGSQGLLVL